MFMLLCHSFLVIILSRFIAITAETELDYYENQPPNMGELDPDDILHFDKSAKYRLNLNYDVNSHMRRHYCSPELKNCNKECHELSQKVQQYITRYVKLFLLATELESKDPGVGDTLITVDMEFTISGRDLSLLQNLSKNHLRKTALYELNAIDLILSEGIKQKELNKKETLDFNAINFNLIEFFSSKVIQYLCVMLVSGLILYFKLQRKVDIVLFLLLTVCGVILIEGIQDYSHKLEKAEINDFNENMKYNENCDPSKVSFVWRWMNMECSTRPESTAEKISLLESIMEKSGFYFLVTPLKIVAQALGTGASEINKFFPKWLQIFTFIPCLMIISGLFIFFYGGRTEFSVLGCRVNLGRGRRQEIQEITAATDEQARAQNVTVQIIQGTSATTVRVLEDQNFQSRISESAMKEEIDGRSQIPRIGYLTALDDDWEKNSADDSGENVGGKNSNFKTKERTSIKGNKGEDRTDLSIENISENNGKNIEGEKTKIIPPNENIQVDETFLEQK